jgi:FtsH-binding integral membrane protein
MSYGYEYSVAAQSAASDRAAFIRRTYAHLAGAILAFMALETLLVQVVDHKTVIQLMNRGSWLIVMLLFIGASMLAQMWARSEASRGIQYLGLGVYVVAWAIVFLPLIVVAADYFSPKVIPQAAILTLAVFGGLTLSVFVTKKDYSFLRPILCVGSMLALGLILAALIFPFNLGLVFCFAMVALMCGYILYDTSNVLLHYRTDQYVAAALALFSSIAMLFWYVLQIVMSMSSRD